MEHTWRATAPSGIIGLIHPDSHFSELRARHLRRETYRRLRRHWQFRNELKLFNEIQHTRPYAVHVYGDESTACFLQGASLYHPETVARSFNHDGSGSVPGVKDEDGKWDLHPHSERIIDVTELQLASWAALIDEPGTQPGEARMMYPVNRASAEVLDKIAAASRLGDIGFEWTPGWHETADRKLGFFRSACEVPSRWEEVILQGPHLTVATPLYQQPGTVVGRERLYASIDLDRIGDDFIPRTNYQVAKSYPEYLAAYPKWGDKPSSSCFRLAWRRMADSAMARTLHSAIESPGPCHINGVLDAALPTFADLAVASGFWASLPLDFFIKAAGASELNQGVVRRLPHIRGHQLEPQLLVRALRLNCLVRPYALLWGELFDKAWQQDSWVPHIGVDYAGRAVLGDVGPTWEWATPLRRAADRRQALVEIDAIVAIMLGITAGELITIYRTQFPVLQKYERDALYDAHGRQLPGKLASEYRKKGCAQARRRHRRRCHLRRTVRRGRPWTRHGVGAQAL
jgi:hypothetical protein